MTETKNKTYVANAFSLNMLALVTGGEVKIKVRRIGVEEFCKAVKTPGVESAIGHQGTADLINKLCGTQIPVDRKSIRLGDGDILYVMTIGVRLPEGKVLFMEELKAMLESDQISFWKVEVL